MRTRLSAVGPPPAITVPPHHTESIERSHLRCAALGLSRIETPDFGRVPQSDFLVMRERNQRLFTHAAPIMDLLFEQVEGTDTMVVLTDAHGVILHSIGDDEFLARAKKVALQPGVNWSESAKGTNAIGTALVNEAPTLVNGAEHFMHANHFLTCSAAPILDPRGSILGVLDVTGEQRSYHRHTLGLVKMSARMIENHWLTDHCRNALRLHFHPRAECIGTLMEGILAVGMDGRIQGANQSALDLLGQSGASLRMQSLSSLLGTSVNALVDHFRAPLAAPLAVALANGRLLHAVARFEWPVWHRLGGNEASSAASAPRAATVNPPAVGSGLRDLQTGDAQFDVVLGKLRRVIDRDIPILIQGETGTGKELLARAIHHDSMRGKHPFVAVNCASIPESLIEAELFGYEDGAFTGARRKGAVGKIAQAHGGTLFLDEIGDMPLPLQARLLRVLQERQVTPLGSAKVQAVDVAVIGATHRKLRDMIAAGDFREDLYYRLNGLVVRLPALRERSDLPTLVSKILRRESPTHALELSDDVARLFARYPWPGNIRQLSNVLRTAVVMAGGEPRIQREHLSDDLLDDLPDAVAAATPSGGVVAPSLPAPHGDLPVEDGSTLAARELAAIRRAVETAGGNISHAAKQLGISRNTVYRKLRWQGETAA